MKKIIFTLLAMFLIANCSYASKEKFWPGEIRFLDGTIKKGYIEAPKNHIVAKISYRQNLSSLIEKIDRDLISSIHLTVGSRDVIFENTLFGRVAQDGSPIIKDKRIILLVVEKGFATLYIAASEYSVSSSNEVTVTDVFFVGPDLPSFEYYLKKEGEPAALYFAMTTKSKTLYGLNIALKKMAELRLQDDIPLLERVRNDEFKHTDIPELIKIYNKDMKSFLPPHSPKNEKQKKNDGVELLF
jgi:hypothetical protein